MIRRVALIAVVLCVAPRARADEASARTEFTQAEALRKAGKWTEACPLYQASYRDDPQLGVLLHLAECHEKIGRLATAWSEFTDAAELAHGRTDSREAIARAAADRLLPRLAKLHLAPPPQLYAGLAVKLDGTDVTVLVGTDMPIDAGDHFIAASAPGYVDWTTDEKIDGEGTIAQLAIPALTKVPPTVVVVPPPKVHEGTLSITAPPGAEIVLDSDQVGVGHYQGKVKSGGHSLRVTAPGMRMYQTEVVVGDDEERKVDVVLEKEPAVVTVAPPPPPPVDSGPSFEAAIGIAPGLKGYGDRPALVAYRFEIGFRFAHRMDFGISTEVGSISTSGNCGTALPGPTPSTPYDFGTRNQFTTCQYLLGSLHLVAHVLPDSVVDPYVGIAPGFRMGFFDRTPYDAAGIAQTPHTKEHYPGVIGAVRVGADYHPTPEVAGWTVGGFVEAQIEVIGDERGDDQSNNRTGKNVSYESWLGGVRTAIAW